MSDPRAQHMARRKAHGVPYRDLADEFGTSKSTAHRKVKAQEKPVKKATPPAGPTKEPAGKPALKWDPKKKPVEVKTDRGTFSFK